MLKCFVVFNLFIVLISGSKASDPVFSFESKEEHLLKVLNHGSLALKERYDLINQAKKTIEIESFIFEDDNSGRILLNALMRKAAQGVEIRLLLDKVFASKTVDPFITHELRDSGVKVRFFNTLPFIFFNRIQYRNHRKSFIVDGKKAIVGGRNIGDEYYDLSDDYNFIDRDVLVKGPVAKAVQRTFNAFWNSKYTKLIKRQPKPQEKLYHRAGNSNFHDTWRFKNSLRRWTKRKEIAKNFLSMKENDKLLVELENFWVDLEAQKINKSYEYYCRDLGYYSDKPSVGRRKTKKSRVLKYKIFDMLRNTKRSVLIETPYFLFDDDTREIFKELLNRKVDVRILTNSLYSSDAIPVGSRFYDIVSKWIDRGLKVHMYAGVSLSDYPLFKEDLTEQRWGAHGKTFIIDSRKVIVGSYNFDPRSNNYNMEHALFCRDNYVFADDLRENVERRLKHSLLLKDKKTFERLKFDRVGLGKRILYYLAKIPAFLFEHLL